ncbi:hypothetical protein ACP4OV_022125 [Aristida adscensionis]
MRGASAVRPPSQLLIISILMLALVVSSPRPSEARPSPPDLAGAPRGPRKLNQVLVSPPSPTSDTTIGTRTTTAVTPPPPV